MVLWSSPQLSLLLGRASAAFEPILQFGKFTLRRLQGHSALTLPLRPDTVCIASDKPPPQSEKTPPLACPGAAERRKAAISRVVRHS